MPRFIVTHTVPFTEEMLKASAKESFPEGVAWKQTYCDFENSKFFCEWEAPSKEMLEQGFKERNIPFDDIFKVRLFDTAKADFV